MVVSQNGGLPSFDQMATKEVCPHQAAKRMFSSLRCSTVTVRLHVSSNHCLQTQNPWNETEIPRIRHLLDCEELANQSRSCTMMGTAGSDITKHELHGTITPSHLIGSDANTQVRTTAEQKSGHICRLPSIWQLLQVSLSTEVIQVFTCIVLSPGERWVVGVLTLRKEGKHGSCNSRCTETCSVVADDRNDY